MRRERKGWEIGLWFFSAYYILTIVTDVYRDSRDIVTSETGTMIIQFSSRRKMLPSCLILKVFDADHRSIHYGGTCTRYWPMMLLYCYYWLRSYWSSPASTPTGGAAASTIFQDERAILKPVLTSKSLPIFLRFTIDFYSVPRSVLINTQY